MTLDILLLPAGSHGDVLPFVGLGRELVRRGHRVTCATSAWFRETCEATGIDFVGIGTREEFLALLHHPDLWRADLRALRYTMQIAQSVMRMQYEVAAGYAGRPGALVLHGMLALGARVAEEHTGVRTATVQLAPAVFRSVERPPRLPGVAMPPWSPRWWRRLQWWLMRQVGDTLFGELQAFRASLGLPPVHDILASWANSPALTVGMFPAWFAEPARDWPPAVRLTGFPLYDAAEVAPLARDVEDFLAECAHDGGPVVFTPGSGNAQAGAFLRGAIGACERGGRPGLILSKLTEVPARLPPRVRHLPWLPFSQVFPRACAVVHHGGIGTTAQALAAGTPQVVTALAYDQFDNGARVEALGVGTLYPGAAPDPARLAARIDAVAALRPRAQAIATRFAGAGGIATTCDLLERYAGV